MSGPPRQHVLPGERWRPVPGYEGLYDVSDHGRVWSRFRGGRFRSLTLHGGGYLQATLNRAGKKQSFKAHQMVARAFIGPDPSPDHEVAHWDNDPRNNHVSNLRWATKKDNQGDRRRHGTHLQGESHPASRLRASQVRLIRLTPGPEVLVGRAFGVSGSTVGRIRRGDCWGHLK